MVDDIGTYLGNEIDKNKTFQQDRSFGISPLNVPTGANSHDGRVGERMRRIKDIAIMFSLIRLILSSTPPSCKFTPVGTSVGLVVHHKLLVLSLILLVLLI